MARLVVRVRIARWFGPAIRLISAVSAGLVWIGVPEQVVVPRAYTLAMTLARRAAKAHVE